MPARSVSADGSLNLVAGNVRYLTPDFRNTPDPIPPEPPTELVLDFLADHFRRRTLIRVGLFQEVMEHHVDAMATAMRVDSDQRGCVNFFPMQELLEPPRPSRNRLGTAIISSTPLVDMQSFPYGDFDADMSPNWDFDGRGRPMSAFWAQGSLALPGYKPLRLGVTHFTHYGHVKERQADGSFASLTNLPPPQMSALERLIYVIRQLNGNAESLLWSADANFDLNGPGGRILEQYFTMHQPPSTTTTFGSWSPAINIGLECVLDALFSQGALGIGDLESYDNLSDHLIFTGHVALERTV